MANHPIPERLYGFAANLETTGGSSASISLSDNAIRLAEPGTIEPVYFKTNRRDGVVTGSLNRYGVPASPQGRMYRIRGAIEMRGAGTAYAAANLPPEDPVIVAHGFSRTVVTTGGSESVTYAFTDNPHTLTSDTMTVQAETANRQYVLVNAVTEELALVWAPGEIARLEFAILGVYSSDAEQALETHTYSTIAPAVWANSTPLALNNGGALTLTGVRSLRAETNATVVTRAYPDATVIAGFKAVDRTPRVIVVGETQAKSSWDPEADLAAATSYTIDATCGSAQYKRVKLNVDTAYLDPEDPPALQFEDQLSHFGCAWICLPATGSAEMDIVYD